MPQRGVEDGSTSWRLGGGGWVAGPALERVSSAVTVATRGRARRLSPEEGEAAIAEFLGLGLPTVDDDQLVHAAYAAAQEYGCAFHDGLYLALARRLDVPLILADAWFHRLIRHLPKVGWLGTYS